VALGTSPTTIVPGGITAALTFDGVARTAILGLKYRNRRAAARVLAEVLVRRLGLRGPGRPHYDLVTWAPTSRRRVAERGYDQAELLARAVAAELGVPCRRLLYRVHGAPQMGRTRAERLTGPSYRARPGRSPRVLVVDVPPPGSRPPVGSKRMKLAILRGKKLKALQGLVPRHQRARAGELQQLSDDALRAKTAEFRGASSAARPRRPARRGVRRDARGIGQRVIGQRHYDVQLMGGAALHFGWVAEMKTGEGKTLVSTLPAYLNALGRQGRAPRHGQRLPRPRDAEWMGRIHRWLGLDVGLVVPGYRPPRAEAPEYACDITYGTNNEFGFDYLRDNMAMHRRRQGAARPQLRDRRRGRLDPHRRGPHAADHLGPRRPTPPSSTTASPASSARSSATSTTTSTRRSASWCRSRRASRRSRRRSASTTSTTRCSRTSCTSSRWRSRPRSCTSATRTTSSQGGEVKIVDEFTGRILEGRRWSEGIHQAVEAKEGVKIKEENQTLATITLQNYFRMYDKLAGMTGTAATEAAELMNTYGLAGGADPHQPADDPHRPGRPHLQERGREVRRRRRRHRREATRRGQPVLVGTISVEKSERLSRMLDKRGIDHEVLNAKQHTREAEIVTQAGRLGYAVTVATNMAGRGVDILLGGNPEGWLAKRC
jgi:preprotein translocase subunit SecA